MKLCIIFKLIILSLLLNIYGCSDENSKFKAEYMATCMQSKLSKKVCRCAYDKTEAKYKIADILEFTMGDYNTNPLAQEYMRDTYTFLQSCYNTYH